MTTTTTEDTTMTKTAALVFTMFPYPKLPVLHVMKPGDDVEVVIRESLGAEGKRETLRQEENDIGIIDVRTVGTSLQDGIIAFVHSNPEMEEELNGLITALKLQVEQEQELMKSPIGMLLKQLMDSGVIPENAGLDSGTCVCGMNHGEDVIDVSDPKVI